MSYTITQLKPFGVLIEAKNTNTQITSLPIQKLRELFLKNQLITLRGFTTFSNSKEFSKYCESWGEVSVWPFGTVLELKKQINAQDHIFDSSYVPMHWDGMYREFVPEFQFFHCIKAPKKSEGGRTIFSNTKNIIKDLTTPEKEEWRSIEGLYKREMEFYNSVTRSKIISQHPYRDFEVIRFNEPACSRHPNFINPPNIQLSNLKDETKFINQLKSKLYSKEYSYSHRWSNNDIVIADNFTLLHGREKFQSESDRHIQRVQVLSNPLYKNPNLESYSE